MSLAIQVPIKATESKRVKGKNFRQIAGKPMWQWTLDKLVNLLEKNNDKWDADIYLDSDDINFIRPIFEFYTSKTTSKVSIFTYVRDKWLASDQANGNHLLTSFAYNNPDYNHYCQLFITSPLFREEMLYKCFDSYFNGLNHSIANPYDSVVPVTYQTGFLWTLDKDKNYVPLNYDPHSPCGLPRSQDNPIIKETTTLYIIKKESLFKKNTRIGYNPNLISVGSMEAVDIDTIDDFEYAEKLLNEL